MIQEELMNRHIPEVRRLYDGSIASNRVSWEKRRKEIVELLSREFAGVGPSFPVKTQGVIIREDKKAYGGKARMVVVEITIHSSFRSSTFPVTIVIPRTTEPVPAFLYLGFTSEVADGIGEEIIDQGYAILHIYYQDITPDKNEDTINEGGIFSGRERPDSWGKLAMWAFGASRALDYLMTVPEIDRTKIAIMGHSRLGKAALWCGAIDERFSIVVSNESGGGGAALFRGKSGEQLKNLNSPGASIWFCRNLFKYVGKEETMPFDQHFLLSLVAPRYLYVCSAQDDKWADPKSEFLACVATSPVYQMLGLQGVGCDGWPKLNEGYHDGRIGYHMRPGTHYLSRDDWNYIIAFRNKHKV